MVVATRVGDLQAPDGGRGQIKLCASDLRRGTDGDVPRYGRRVSRIQGGARGAARLPGSAGKLAETLNADLRRRACLVVRVEPVDVQTQAVIEELVLQSQLV